MDRPLATLSAQPGSPAFTVIEAKHPEDLDALFRLRRRIYVREMGLLREDHPFVCGPLLVDPYDQWSTNLLLKVGGRAAGSVRVTRASEGRLEIDEYTDASARCPQPSRALEVTRFMVAREFRGGPAGSLLLHAMWKQLLEWDVRYLLAAGKVGSLGRYYKNLCAAGLRVEPEPFTYGLTGCRYQLLIADTGAPGSLRRLAWRAHIGLLATLVFGPGRMGLHLTRRGTRRSALMAAR